MSPGPPNPAPAEYIHNCANKDEARERWCQHHPQGLDTGLLNPGEASCRVLNPGEVSGRVGSAAIRQVVEIDESGERGRESEQRREPTGYDHLGPPAQHTAQDGAGHTIR